MWTDSILKGILRLILSRFFFDQIRGVPLAIPLLLLIQTILTLFVLMKLVNCCRPKSNLRLSQTSFGSENILKIENLTKRYRKKPEPALQNVSFDIKQNSFVFLLGPNGAGKSTLINILGDVIPKSAGVISQLAPGNLAICYHENSLYDHLTVSEHLRMFGDLFESKREFASNLRSPAQFAYEPNSTGQVQR